jgi:hypothetical protein
MATAMVPKLVSGYQHLPQLLGLVFYATPINLLPCLGGWGGSGFILEVARNFVPNLSLRFLRLLAVKASLGTSYSGAFKAVLGYLL